MLLVKGLADEFISGIGHASSEVGIGGHFLEGLCERNFVIHGNEEAADTVLDYFIRPAGAAGGDDGGMAGEGFDEDIGESFPAAAEGKAVSGSIEGEGIFLETQPADL